MNKYECTSIGIGIMLLCGCYSSRWSTTTYQPHYSGLTAVSPVIYRIFAQHPHGVIECAVETPGLLYKYDISEKDSYFDNAGRKLAYNRVTLRLIPQSPPGQVQADITFYDEYSNYLLLMRVDLMRIVPSIDAQGTLQYAEYLLEEFNRFGVLFRKEQNEISLHVDKADTELAAAARRAYRVSLVNNCLDPTKWELQLASEDYSDWTQRRKSSFNLNQDKMLSHAWFYLDKELYAALLRLKNPQVYDPELFQLPYDSLTALGEKAVVDFATLRPPLGPRIPVTLVEVGHKSGRKITAVDPESHYKRTMGLLGPDTIHTYASILEGKRSLAKFHHEGYYDPGTPNVYDYSFLKGIDDVQIRQVKVPGADCYVEITLTGNGSFYNFTIGNIDLATLEEQRLYGINTGINLYPISRRYNPPQSTLSYDPDITPADRRPYFLMTEKESGHWVNNQWKGVEKALLGFNALDPKKLEIYLISYERETPVWYACVRLNGATRELIRARRSLYNY